MRILIVTPWFPTAGAPQTGLFVAREAEALAEAHDVRVLHLDWTGPAGSPSAPAPTPYTVERVRLRRFSPLDDRRARHLVRTAARDADVVHTHALTLLLPWLATGRPADLPWIHSEHWSALTAPETVRGALAVALRLLRPMLRRPDVVVAESSRLAAAVDAIRTGPTAIVPCVVPEVPVLEPPGGEPVRLIGIGGLIPRKGPLLAVRTLRELVADGMPAELVWVGDGPERAAVIAEAARLGLADRVDLTGVLDSAGVGAQLDAAHALLLPTQGDNFCVVAAEALVHGRPIVSGSATGAVDYAQPRVSRFVSDQRPAAYAAAVRELLADTAALSAADVAATVADRFTPRAVRTALEDVYRRAGTS
ncbi:glycosyltransferase family 4 protein [Microbacterium hominis]|uniref:Glycosyltransferase family 4 protein n=1 Tax=Microbacterium hominis TaxID=162426 RepID=A0A7D4TGE5_9MICO|nr:glycosyltransferase family 4 protein [Microbacterium hominis]QKJ20020.1 glycosyltransferase family 4 protein [Microbacterium hominis]